MHNGADKKDTEFSWWAGPQARLRLQVQFPQTKQCLAIPFFPLSVCLSDCPPSCAVLGADLHRKRSRGWDGCQGLHYHLWGPRGHRGAVPGQVREPHQQVRERNGRRGPKLPHPSPLVFCSRGQLLLVPEAVWDLSGVSLTLGVASAPCIPQGHLVPLSAYTRALGPICGVGVGLEQARVRVRPRLLAIWSWVIFRECSSLPVDHECGGEHHRVGGLPRQRLERDRGLERWVCHPLCLWLSISGFSFLICERRSLM